MKNFMKSSKSTPCQLAWVAVIVLFLLLACTYLLRSISDPDFFWHLKTGEWIWLNGHLPTSDPFTFTGPEHPNLRQLLILQGYPLAQLLYYGLYQALGWAGIYLLRFILAAAFLLVFMARFSLSGFNNRHSWLLVGSLLMLYTVLCLQPYTLDRPQAFSFLFFSVLLLIYEWIISRDFRWPWWYVILPAFVLMAVWGNTHGLSIIGLAILTVITGAEVFLYLAGRRDRKKFLAVTGLVSGGIAGCLLNVTRLDLSIISGVLNTKSSQATAYNYEYLSTWQYYQMHSDNNILIFWGFMALVVILLCCTRSSEKQGELLIIIAVGIYALLAVRYIPFFVIAAIPFVYAKFISSSKLDPLKYIVVTVTIMLFAYSVADEIDNASLLKKFGPVCSVFPVAATDFLITSNLQGRIFNPYDWGGYLLWRLAPERKIYQDGRALEEQVFIDWLSTLTNVIGRSGLPIWQEIMNKYDINVAILPKFSEYTPGPPHELAYAMANNREWKLLYQDSLAVVFQRVK